jgi:hypothetical protein
VEGCCYCNPGTVHVYRMLIGEHNYGHIFHLQEVVSCKKISSLGILKSVCTIMTLHQFVRLFWYSRICMVLVCFHSQIHFMPITGSFLRMTTASSQQKRGENAMTVEIKMMMGKVVCRVLLKQWYGHSRSRSTSSSSRRELF